MISYSQNNDILLFEVLKNTESKNAKLAKTKNRKTLHSSKFAISDSKNLRFIRQPEAKGLLGMI